MKTFASLDGETLIDNERVHVERFALAPGAATGRWAQNMDRLIVFVRGGVLRSASSGRRTLWPDGRVLWCGARDAIEAGAVNAGRQAVDFVVVALKPPAAPAAAACGTDVHLDYPNIPGEDLLENERLVVQRFLVLPGQWEGVHGHRPNTLYIHLKGGKWAVRSKTQAERAYDEPAADGEVGWMPEIDPSEGHESGNAGREPIDLIWVTLK